MPVPSFQPRLTPSGQWPHVGFPECANELTKHDHSSRQWTRWSRTDRTHKDPRNNQDPSSTSCGCVDVTAEEFRATRLAAGLTTVRAAAQALESDRRTVQRWKAGERAVRGPARVALRLLLQARLAPGYSPTLDASHLSRTSGSD